MYTPKTKKIILNHYQAITHFITKILCSFFWSPELWFVFDVGIFGFVHSIEKQIKRNPLRNNAAKTTENEMVMHEMGDSSKGPSLNQTASTPIFTYVTLSENEIEIYQTAFSRIIEQFWKLTTFCKINLRNFKEKHEKRLPICCISKNIAWYKNTLFCKTITGLTATQDRIKTVYLVGFSFFHFWVPVRNESLSVFRCHPPPFPAG